MVAVVEVVVYVRMVEEEVKVVVGAVEVVALEVAAALTLQTFRRQRKEGLRGVSLYRPLLLRPDTQRCGH